MNGRSQDGSTQAAPTPCTHPRTTMCHGTLRWVCDVCGAVGALPPAERVARLEGRLREIRRLGRGHDRRRAVA